MTEAQPDGYLALPPSGKGDAVLLLHAWWGLNDTMKATGDRLAAAGFVVFAPDLYHGEIATTIPDAERLSSALDARSEQVIKDIQAAIRFLQQRSGAEKIVVIGFSLGAAYALHLSAAMPETIRAVVVFYGSGGADFNKSQATYLAHFAGDDEYEPEENVAWLEGAIRQAGRPLTLYRYPGTGHWFFEADRPQAYNQAAADLAWERTLAFLRTSATS